MPGLSIAEIGRRMTAAGQLTLKPLCTYGTDERPEDVVPSTDITQCVAEAVFLQATNPKIPPLFIARNMPRKCCGGGLAQFGLQKFDPKIKYFVSTGRKDFFNGAAEYLRATPDLVEENWRRLGKITPMGRYNIIRPCKDLAKEDPGVRAILCFAGAEQIRNMCALVHFHTSHAFDSVLAPQGPSCASFVTFASGMVENAPRNAVFLGPADPTGNSWFPPDLMSISIPIQTARRMCEDLDKSFLTKRPQVAYPERE